MPRELLFGVRIVVMLACLMLLLCNSPNGGFMVMLPLVMSVLLPFLSRISKRAQCCWVVEVLLVPAELCFGVRIVVILPCLMLLHCNSPNVFIVMLPLVVSVLHVWERDYQEYDAQ